MITAEYVTDRFGTPAGLAARIAQTYNNGNQGLNVREQFLGVGVAKDGIAYYFISRLGGGSHGEAFAASVDGTRRARYAVKVFNLNPDSKQLLPEFMRRQPHDYEFYQEVVEREFAVSAVIRRRLGEAFCDDHVVCAIERFYRTDFSLGYIAFPYISPLTLTVYLAVYTHARMREYSRKVQEYGMTGLPVRELRRLSQREDEVGRNAYQLERELRLIQLSCINIARQVLMTAARLHEAEIIHMDMKPDNILVDQDRVLLIDFGIACVGSMEQDALYDVQEKFVLACPEVFDTTYFYKDPLANIIRVEDETMRVVTFARLEVYTLGKILQTIFDPATTNESGSEIYFPVVRRTEFMLTGLYNLIVNMTGEDGHGLSGNNQHHLTPRELQLRREGFQYRPTSAGALQIFTNLVLGWTNNGGQ